MPVAVRLVDIGGAQRQDAVLHHAPALAEHDADRQAARLVVPRGDAVAPVLGEEARPGLQIVLVDGPGVVEQVVLDPLARLRVDHA